MWLDLLCNQYLYFSNRALLCALCIGSNGTFKSDCGKWSEFFYLKKPKIFHIWSKEQWACFSTLEKRGSIFQQNDGHSPKFKFLERNWKDTNPIEELIYKLKINGGISGLSMMIDKVVTSDKDNSRVISIRWCYNF